MGQETRLTVNDAQVLLTCCELEKACGRIYWHFSRLFAGEKQMKKLWQKTAMEEDGHSEQCMLAYHMRGSGMVSVTVSEERASELLARVQGILDEVQRNPPTLKAALKLALLLEEHMACCHVDKLVVFSDPHQKKFFDSLRTVDRDHVEALELAYDHVLSAELRAVAQQGSEDEPKAAPAA